MILKRECGVIRRGRRTPAIRRSGDVLEATALIAQAAALAEPVAEVEELRATGIAAADDFDLGESGRVHRDRALIATMRRTEIMRLIPRPVSAKSTPWKIWMRSLSPSMIL